MARGSLQNGGSLDVRAERDLIQHSAPAWMGKLRPRQVKLGVSKTHAHGV